MPVHRLGKAKAARNRVAAASTFTPPYGAGSTRTSPPMPARKPLIPDLGDTELRRWSFADHAAVRMAERGVGVFEVLSALYAPDWSSQQPRTPGRVKAVRGDIEVIYDPRNRYVFTVVDRLETVRTRARIPLHPPALSTPPKGIAMPAPEVPPAKFTPPTPEVMTQPQRKPTPGQPTGEPPTAVDYVLAALDRAGPDSPISLRALADGAPPEITYGALSMALRAMSATGRVVHVGSPRSGQYRNGDPTKPTAMPKGYRKPPAKLARTPIRKPAPPAPVAAPSAPRTAQHAPPAPEATPAPRVRATAPVGYTGETLGAVAAVFAFADPPAGTETELAVEHLRALLRVLKEQPGSWARVLLVQGDRKEADAYADLLEETIAEPALALMVRPHPEASGHAIYARYAE
jgi:hypothetical protein